MSDNPQPEYSPTNASTTERRIRRLVVPEPSGFPQTERIDFIHDPGTEPLWGPA